MQKLLMIPIMCWFLTLIFINTYHFAVPMAGMVSEPDLFTAHFWWTAVLSYIFYGFLCFNIPLLMLIQYMCSKWPVIVNHNYRNGIEWVTTVMLCLLWALYLSQPHF
ncbi:hypothetical protein PSECIP111951_02769 [Pseudoalteromonas holothuriae]|uniref:Uncharacterized protein n=1 Tax=Pseudoalteromonas holothuriae TaxID=2963714 RepID=A0A9W4QVS1_9GAMM|nr:hypothetical protein PSECIP111854_01547 [Pseudoalteromonas sp. CIP111854]CAH9062788.1 hypothetical protein PSECIP111951_02769 [Pseudoalteromonas sp. CIP111951]